MSVLEQLQTCATYYKKVLLEQYDTNGTQLLQKKIVALLVQEGPLTVPMIAKYQGVTRQNIQVAVNEMLTLGLVTKSINTSHKRSMLIALTTVGKGVYEHSRQENMQLCETLGLTQNELETLENTLHKIEVGLKNMTKQSI